MKKYLKTFATVLVTAVALSGCDFGDINVNPNAPTDAPMNVLLPAAQANLAYGIHGDIAQFTSIFLQQTSGVNNIYLTVGQYDLNGNLAGRVWDGNLYPGAMNDLNIVIRKATQQNAPHYRGVARVMMANALGQAVDLWNNVPYSDAFRGNDAERVLQPRYDRAEALYDTIQNVLNQAIADLQATSSTLSPGRDDLVYGGDRTRWTQAARALKARYFNHLSKVNAEQSARDALAQLQAGTFAANAQDARIVFGNTIDAAAPWFRFSQSTFGTGIRVSSTLVQLMQQRNDPRLPFYAAPFSATSGIVGARPGQADEAGTAFVGPYYNRAEAPTNFITFVEVKFIEAEANFRLGRLAEAAAAHNAAVAASIAKVTVSITGAATNAVANTAYISQFGSETAASITLEKILTEKYFAMYLDPEAWTDWRRSVTTDRPNGVPALQPAANSQQFTGGRLPRRWPYPISEVQQNRANVEAQGSATLTDRVFWDR
jgi:hypothetical protein